jgi:hypothetical protein
VNETKASRLGKLADYGLGGNVLSQFSLRKAEFSFDPNAKVDEVTASLGSGPFAVRSSAQDEDQSESMAGKYLTLLNVPSNDLVGAITAVFDSYSTNNNENEVLIQPFIRNAVSSGVVFTVEPNIGSRYQTVNWTSGQDTTLITSGANNGNSLVVFDGMISDEIVTGDLRAIELLELVKRVQEIEGSEALDIEWIQTEESTFILQVRPLTHAEPKLSTNLVAKELSQLTARILDLQQGHPYLAGKSTIFGVMPDWNPAELIGIRPNVLALTLFKELISDSIWAYERGNLGYRNLRSFPLVLDFGGHPYVDLRVSLNSLIPSDVPDELASKLVDYYLRKLNLSPELHDKIEFEIVLSCFSFDWDLYKSELDEFLNAADQARLKSSLIGLTKDAIAEEKYGLAELEAKQQPLPGRFRAISDGELNAIGKAFWFIEDCKRYGTLPFAGIARLAFIATRLLGSLVKIGVVTEVELLAFMSQMETRTSEMVRDQERLAAEEFIQLYGHLRPGTFDITVPNYANAFDAYFPTFGSHSQNPARRIDSNLARSFVEKVLLFAPDSELAVPGETLLKFCQRAIIAREESKFLFSKHVSGALEAIAEVAQSVGFTRADAAHIRVQTIQDSYKDPGDLRSRIREDIALGVEREKLSHSISLPTLIRSPEEVTCFQVSDVGANFVTLLSVAGELMSLTSPIQDISGKIVLIESADPGFDWIFTRGIAGMITAWGGANSHMSIRAKELGIPSAIGVGEKLYRELARSKTCRIDCANKRIEVLS